MFQVLCLLLLSLVLAVYSFLDQDITPRLSKRFLVLLSIVTGTVVVFIRLAFGRYFTTIDESYYISLLGDPYWYWNSIVSGYITPFSLHILHYFFENPVNEVIWYSTIVAVVYVFLLFYIYRLFGLSYVHSIFSEIVLLMTPLFIWSMIQIRPQQIGLLVGLLLTAVFVNKSPSWKLFLVVSSLFILLIFSHLLSFIVYSALLVGYVTLSALLERQTTNYRYKSVMLVVSIPLSWIVFLSFPYSRPILKNLTWLFNVTFGTRFSPTVFQVVSSFGVLLLLLLWYFVLIHFGDRFACSLSSIWHLVRRRVSCGQHPPRRILLLIGEVMVFAGAYLQFRFGSSLYLRIYSGSLWSLLLFQMGNIVFALLYLKGLLKQLDHGIGKWAMLSGIMAIIAGIMLVVSFFMPSGNGIWGFHNWFIRGLQFFVPLASPIVAEVLLNDVHTDRSTFMKVSVSLLVSSLVMVSVLNTARVPGVYSYGAVWDPELVNLCSTFHGVYVSREPQGRFSEFVEGNLLKACGNELYATSSGQILVSSDSFNILEGEYLPLSLQDFVGSVKALRGNVLIVSGGEVSRNSFILSLFPGSRLVPVSRNEGCPLDELPGAVPSILVGGPGVNPCSKSLSAVISVKLGVNYVITPCSKYSVPSPSPWWNATKGLFVIYSVEYSGRPVLLIEGTNLDATLAGVYYFYSHIYMVSSVHRDAHYIVGEWIERDGKVLPFARGTPGDNNGFSYGDKIKILEQG